MTTLDVTRLLGGPRVLGRQIDSDLELDEAIAEGLPSGSLTALMHETDLSAGDLIFFFTSNHRRKGTFSGTVRPHDGVYFSRMDFQIDTFKNLKVSYFRV